MELKDTHCTALGGAEDTAEDAVAGPALLPKSIRERPDGTDVLGVKLTTEA